MPIPALSIAERHNIDTGPWFAKLSAQLRQAILDVARVRRLQDGELLAARGAAAEEWCGVAAGAVRVSSVSLAGKQVSLTYVEPGPRRAASSTSSVRTPDTSSISVTASRQRRAPTPWLRW